ncbi:MAG: 1-deoxy-D-xylulose-5-phosphate reductoisomerase [bacterium]
MYKNIVILGSTGSIGTQSLEVIDSINNLREIEANNSINNNNNNNCRKCGKYIKVIALSTNVNIELLEKQIRKYNPIYAVVVDEEKAEILRKKVKDTMTTILKGEKELIKIVTLENVNLVLNALVGNVGLIPTIYAINNKKDVALANKETLVSAGELVMHGAKVNNINIYPIDSEHSAIFQCLQGNNISEVEKIILTASGGPFRYHTRDELQDVTLEEALKHPNWSMGKKITIDSATLMNKGLEMIEAKWLFGLDINQIEVIVHPQSVVHSMVEFKDSAIIAQLGTPDMKVPIQYALDYPNRIKNDFEKLNLLKYNNLTFQEPNYELFPCLSYAYDAIIIGGTMPCVLNASNEIAVDKFLNRQIEFLDIPKIINLTMKEYKKLDLNKLNYDLDDVLEADKWAREYARNINI